MLTLDDLRVTPIGLKDDPETRRYWHGRFISLDGTDAGPFDTEHVAELLAAGQTGDDWTGDVAAVVRLVDGRYACWETFWGPTGNGFSEEAYGGDADVSFGATYEVCWTMGLTDTGRELCQDYQARSRRSRYFVSQMFKCEY